MLSLRRRLKDRLAAQLRGLRSDTRGVTAVEFALLTVPFLIVMIAILETGYMFFLAILIEGATADASRQIRTGAAQLSGAPLDQFQQVLCGNVYGMVPCGELLIDVRNYSRFGDAPPIGGNVGGGAGAFAPGNPGDVVVVQVSYQWSFITPLLDQVLGAASGTQRTFISSAAFRNEPFLGALD